MEDVFPVLPFRSELFGADQFAESVIVTTDPAEILAFLGAST